jgi:2-iminobutanoate/2-iminopropanoate deaminase
MTRDARQPPDVARPTPPYSPVVVADPLVFTAGQVAMRPDGTLVDGGIEEQTQQVLDNVERCLAAAGCSMHDVVKVTAFLSDLENFEGYNRVYYPARSTVGARLTDGLLVEIEAVALLRHDR